jgi:hypothetical protein
MWMPNHDLRQVSLIDRRQDQIKGISSFNLNINMANIREL